MSLGLLRVYRSSVIAAYTTKYIFPLYLWFSYYQIHSGLNTDHPIMLYAPMFIKSN